MAQEFCDKGLVSVNGMAARSAKEVKPGDVLEIRRRGRVTRLHVDSIPASKQVAKSAAADHYTILSDEMTADGPELA